MTAQTAVTSVRSSVVVETGIDRAFNVFTTGIDTWWAKDRHIVEGEVAEMIFEPRVGGQIIDRTVDGRECRWARVLAYEPPHRVVFSWDINNQWQIEADPSKTSEVEVTFTADGPNRTRVELEHRNLDRHGDGWESHREAVSGADGWDRGLQDYAAALRDSA